MKLAVAVLTGLFWCVLCWTSPAHAQVLRSWVSGVASNYAGGHNYNSSGSENLVTQLGTGRFRLLMRGIGGPGGTVQISLLGGLGTATSCNAEAWYYTPAGDQEIYVRCFDGIGLLADGRFSVIYNNNPPLNVPSPPRFPGGGELGYAWIGAPGSVNAAPIEYASGPTVVTRISAGRYSITPAMLVGVAASSWGVDPPLSVYVTGYGGLPVNCSGKDSGGIIVQCFNRLGHAVDAMFTVLVLRGATPIARNPAGVATVYLGFPGNSFGRTSTGSLASFTVASATQMRVFFPGLALSASGTIAPIVSSATAGVWCRTDSVSQVGDGVEAMVGCSGPGFVTVGLFR